VRVLSAVVASIAIVASAPAAQSLLGRISFPTSAPPPAQPAFVRAVLLLHNFEYDDAILAFREVQRLAPGFALGYWGEALSYTQPLWYNEDVAKARQALSRLASTTDARLAKAATPREKGYLDAVERLYGPGDLRARRQAFADRMAALVAASPDDDEAKAFYALALLGTIPEGQRSPAVSLKAGELASGVLQRNPSHPGAAHYALHAYDDGVNNRRGLEAARIYAKIAPASSHALHMPSHVFLPLGMWDEAAAADEASYNASVEWVKRTGRTIDQQDFHSLSWLQYEYLQQGRFADARRLLEPVERALALTRGATTSTTSHVHSEIGRGYDATSLRRELASMRARYVVESRDWSLMKGQATFDNVDELFAVGLSGVGTGDLPRADAALGHLRKAAASQPDADAREVASITADQLGGLLQFVRGSRQAGLAQIARAADAEARRPRPIARPYPIKPVSEFYGELLLGEGDARSAIAQFRRALDRTPRRAASLFGLASAAAVAGDAALSAQYAREFLSVWRLADPERSEIADARLLLGTRR
jgi:tetratricopeptide (TPR) repeat protein